MCFTLFVSKIKLRSINYLSKHKIKTIKLLTQNII